MLRFEFYDGVKAFFSFTVNINVHQIKINFLKTQKYFTTTQTCQNRTNLTKSEITRTATKSFLRPLPKYLLAVKNDSPKLTMKSISYSPIFQCFMISIGRNCIAKGNPSEIEFWSLEEPNGLRVNKPLIWPLLAHWQIALDNCFPSRGWKSWSV